MSEARGKKNHTHKENQIEQWMGLQTNSEEVLQDSACFQSFCLVT